MKSINLLKETQTHEIFIYTCRKIIIVKVIEVLLQCIASLGFAIRTCLSLALLLNWIGAKPFVATLNLKLHRSFWSCISLVKRLLLLVAELDLLLHLQVSHSCVCRVILTKSFSLVSLWIFELKLLLPPLLIRIKFESF